MPILVHAVKLVYARRMTAKPTYPVTIRATYHPDEELRPTVDVAAERAETVANAFVILRATHDGAHTEMGVVSFDADTQGLCTFDQLFAFWRAFGTHLLQHPENTPNAQKAKRLFAFIEGLLSAPASAAPAEASKPKPALALVPDPTSDND